MWQLEVTGQNSIKTCRKKCQNFNVFIIEFSKYKHDCFYACNCCTAFVVGQYM